MSKPVELPDDVYQRLEEEASAAGTTPAEWIAAQLPKRCPECEGSASPDHGSADTNPAVAGEISIGSVPQKTLADRLAGRIGRIASGGSERLAQSSGDAFTDYLLAKKREGRL